ncbi:DEKNAAC104662 [Brettanomyces naardenensis]|uniref:DEKNAAC104662 n=1 Tax=Brettanomyces naardenensis TaxID=13370 RepID=A0A448YR87_BRENA|nr:DEKNAAC104662 [Brettanomyces naardenensis]
MTPDLPMKSEKPIMKHVSRACLACRSRHLKCDGREPACSRCVKAHRPCQYVKSNRGGSRRKGVSLKRRQGSHYSEIESVTSTTSSKDTLRSEDTSPDADRFVLPCVKNGRADLEGQPGCVHQCMTVENFNKLPPCLSGGQVSQEGEEEEGKINMYPTFNASKSQDALSRVFDPLMLAPSLDKCYISPALTKDLDVESIVNTYYKYFHHIHPFLPMRRDVMTYLYAIPNNYDILLAMKIIGDGQASDVYSRDVETVQFLVTSVMNFIKQTGKDLISLQSLLILSMVAHISSLHDLSMLLREALVSLTLELRLHILDQNTVPDVFMDVNGYITERSGDNNNNIGLVKNGVHLMNTPSDTDAKGDVLTELMQARRVAGIPKRLLADTVRRTLWEVYFFDTISGTASGNTMSLLASKKILVRYPTDMPATVFDFKSRAEACKLVNDSIKLNVAIQANREVQSHLVHMKAAIGNWEMKLENPDLYNAPYLVNPNGNVNEGVFEAMMLVNYAQIFTHRPFSYLWRPDVSKHPKCTDEEGVTDNCPALKKQEVDSRKIIETRKTIESASSLVRCLLDMNPAKVTRRTPFLACALAFSCLVHLSAYSWVDSSLQVLGDSVFEVASLKDNINEEELETYTEYIKLELGAIYQISRHWALSAKLSQHIKDTLKRVSPKLLKKVQAGMPEPRAMPVEVGSVRAVPIVNPAPSIPPPPFVPLASSVPSSIKDSNVPLMRSPREAANRALYETPSLSTSSSTQQTDTTTKTPGDDALLGVLSKQKKISAGTGGKKIASKPAAQNAINAGAVSGNVSDFNDTDFNMMMDDNYLSLSPSCDTGCDWVDKHIFEFDAYNLAGGDETK